MRRRKEKENNENDWRRNIYCLLRRRGKEKEKGIYLEGENISYYILFTEEKEKEENIWRRKMFPMTPKKIVSR